MKTVELTRARTFCAFVDFFEEIGVPVEDKLYELKLPQLRAVEDGRALLPLQPCIRFIENTCAAEGVDDVAIRAISRKPAYSLPSLWNSPVVPGLSGLEKATSYIQMMCQLQPSLQARIEFHHGTARFSITRYGDSTHADDQSMANWTMVMQLINVIRASTGRDWSPDRISLRGRSQPSHYAREAFPGTEILTGSESTWVEVPLCLLAAPAASLPDRAKPPSEFSHNIDDSETQLLAGQLKGMIRTYMAQPNAGLGRLADMLCCSSRTLQRRLQEATLDYRRLLREARYERAVELLESTDLPVIEISSQTGYSDPSHFARAFGQISGVSPLHYRRLYRLQQNRRDN